MDSGIYKITNIITNDFYIGSSCQIKKRKYVHFYQLVKNIHNNTYLQNTFNKYGVDNFKFEVIEECSKDILLIKEQYYINALNPVYNNLKVAGNSLGYTHSIDSIVKLQKQDKTYCSKKVYQYDKNNIFVKEWNSCSEYGNFYNISRAAVIKAIKKNHKCRGYIISYNPPTL